MVTRQEIDYKSPAFYADTLNIDTRLSNVSTTRIEFEYEIRNQNGKTICVARTVMACVGADFKPKAISDEIKKKLS